MKILKRVIFVIILVSISIGLLVIGNGYDMYKTAIQEVPLAEKIETIRKKRKLCKNRRSARNV